MVADLFELFEKREVMNIKLVAAGKSRFDLIDTTKTFAIIEVNLNSDGEKSRVADEKR